MNKRLIVLEGFDRSGKNTLLEDLKKENLPNTYVYDGFLDNLPKYDKEEGKFIDWLNKLIDKQTTDVLNLLKTYDTVIMVRLIVSDEVYSKLFNREHTTIKYMSKLKDIEIFNYCLLFKNYYEYLKRLDLIHDTNIQYDKNNFDSINNLYKEILKNIRYKYYINYVNFDTSKEDILNNFKNIIYNYE